MVGRVKTVLDTVATVSMIAASASVIWFTVFKKPQTPTVAAGPTRPAAEPVQLKEPLALLDAAQPIGGQNAPLVVVEFTDFECPFCGRFARETLPQLIRDFVDTGKVRYAVRNFPLEGIHANASLAAAAAECSARQQKYWQMHELLFANQKTLDRPSLLSHAGAVGLDPKRFEGCLTNGEQERLAADQRLAQKLGVRSTPTFFIGQRRGDSVELLRKISGAQPYENFKTALEQMLAGSS